jgi:hypothetical protein
VLEAEAEITWRPARGLFISGSVAYLDTESRAFRPPQRLEATTSGATSPRWRPTYRQTALSFTQHDRLGDEISDSGALLSAAEGETLFA